MVSATSAGCPNRPIGVSSASRSRVSWEANPIMVGVDDPGGHGVDGDPRGGYLLGQGLGKGDYRPLGGGVGHLAGPAHLAPHGGDSDDPSGVAVNHVGEHGSGRVEYAAGVHRQQPCPLGVGDILEQHPGRQMPALHTRASRWPNR